MDKELKEYFKTTIELLERESFTIDELQLKVKELFEITYQHNKDIQNTNNKIDSLANGLTAFFKDDKFNSRFKEKLSERNNTDRNNCLGGMFS